ncbi:NAD(P)-binding domain-containing protein [Asanoa sp. NPDC049518]|uniref:NAD(P)-dependent oxidoreductase n=1 Tax=unclassified Asanoa TaxID=2685164 RepID=UPI00341BA059
MRTVNSPPPRVSVVGTGAIGSAVVRRLLASAHEVAVWNRTPGRAAELGASPQRSVGDAVAHGTLVFLALTDYAAVRQCLAEIDSGQSGTTIVGLYTGTAEEARLTARRVHELGARYLDAGIQASPEMIDAGTATILYSGSRDGFEQHQPTLALLGRPRLVGEAPEAAAVWDLALFGVWYDAQLGLLRALEAARGTDIDVAEFAETAATQLGHVVASAGATAAEVRQASYPRGPADLTEHLTVIRHLIDLRSGHRLGDGGLPSVAARIESLIADGRGGEGLTATLD